MTNKKTVLLLSIFAASFIFTCLAEGETAEKKEKLGAVYKKSQDKHTLSYVIINNNNNNKVGLAVNKKEEVKNEVTVANKSKNSLQATNKNLTAVESKTKVENVQNQPDDSKKISKGWLRTACEATVDITVKTVASTIYLALVLAKIADGLDGGVKTENIVWVVNANKKK